MTAGRGLKRSNKAPAYLLHWWKLFERIWRLRVLNNLHTTTQWTGSFASHSHAASNHLSCHRLVSMKCESFRYLVLYHSWLVWIHLWHLWFWCGLTGCTNMSRTTNPRHCRWARTWAQSYCHPPLSSAPPISACTPLRHQCLHPNVQCRWNDFIVGYVRRAYHCQLPCLPWLIDKYFGLQFLLKHVSE